jgi:hypothetical protein
MTLTAAAGFGLALLGAVSGLVLDSTFLIAWAMLLGVVLAIGLNIALAKRSPRSADPAELERHRETMEEAARALAPQLPEQSSRAAVENLVLASAAWGWEMGKSGGDALPEPNIEWTHDLSRGSYDAEVRP